jgi:hypothetical protein
MANNRIKSTSLSWHDFLFLFYARAVPKYKSLIIPYIQGIAGSA